MGVPQHRQSKTRVRTRRAMWKLSVPNHIECPQCHQPKMPHFICPNCGYYNSKVVVPMESEG